VSLKILTGIFKATVNLDKGIQMNAFELVVSDIRPTYKLIKGQLICDEKEQPFPLATQIEKSQLTISIPAEWREHFLFSNHDYYPDSWLIAFIIYTGDWMDAN